IADIHGDLSFRYKDTATALLTEPILYDVRELRRAIKGLGTDESTLIEIIFSRDSKTMKEIKARYTSEYGTSLEEDISGDCGGHLKTLLLQQVKGARDPSLSVNMDLAQHDAKDLYKAGEGRLGTNENEFDRVLSSRSYLHLAEVVKFYKQNVGNDLEKAIRSETSGALRDAYLAILHMSEGTPTYFAHWVYKYTKGLGTNDTNLIRVIVSRCEIDMVQIKQAYFHLFGQTLADCVKGDTSGDYRNLLVALIK
ncbi:annexin A4-like, partial [Argonauta hians]